MTRVLMVADGGWPTGFERVARGIGTHLQASGRFEVIHRGLGFGPDSKTRVEPYPYELKPVRQSHDDPLAVTQIPSWLKEDKPDVVLFIQDIWNQVNYLGYVPRDLPTIGYYPVDTPNIKWSYAMALASLTEAVPYTRFGARESAIGVRELVDVVVGSHAEHADRSAVWMTLPKDGMELHMRSDRLAARQNVAAYDPIPHGIEHARFYQLPKSECRAAWGIPQDAFVVLNVNTNQFRKRQDITIRAFAKFAATNPRALLVLHCMGGKDRDGWDLAQLAKLYGVSDKVICTHWAYPELTDEQLLTLYNTADVHVNTSGGEGWGLTSCESALCGVPQLVPDWSATREIWAGAAQLLPVLDYRFEPKYINTAHAILDVAAIADIFTELARDPFLGQVIGQACQDRARSLPSWEAVGAVFADRVDHAIISANTSAEPIRLGDIRATRVGELTSELL